MYRGGEGQDCRRECHPGIPFRLRGAAGQAESVFATIGETKAKICSLVSSLSDSNSILNPQVRDQRSGNLGSGLEISLSLGCAKRDKGQASRLGPQESEKTYNSRPDPFLPFLPFPLMWFYLDLYSLPREFLGQAVHISCTTPTSSGGICRNRGVWFKV